MDRWARLVDHLANGEDRVRLDWNELEGLVGPLPASASNHRAWWSGERPHVRAWQSAGFTLGTLVQREFVEFRRGAPAVGRRPARRAMAMSEVPPSGADILLVACVKKKLGATAAARDLYVSPLFVKGRAYAESGSIPWFILSAKYGLVAPEEWLEPYEMYLPDMAQSERITWGEGVVERLKALMGPLGQAVVEIHAGRSYVDTLRLPLRRAGAQVVEPLAGLRQGERLRWYNSRPSVVAATAAVEFARATAVDYVDGCDGLDGLADVAVAYLTDRRTAVSPREFVARGRNRLTSPGLYSWWVDRDGADDLSAGLGVHVAEGLVYAGLAGATRWPSGRRSTNTLWSRIAGMHLGRNQELSTFRKTLAAVLASAWSTPGLDEERLTDWMRQHLTVVTMASDDPDGLGRLEESVLQRLDPPLNLRGMDRTATRRRLSELRSALPKVQR